MERGKLPKIITIAQEIAYLRALAETGNATLAAEKAGVSKSWTYKKRREDAAFDALCRRTVAAARVRLKEEARTSPLPAHTPPLRGHSVDPDGSMEPSGPLRPPAAEAPHPARAARESTLSPLGRGVDGGAQALVVQMGKRVQVRRARAGEWTAETDWRFLGALASAKDLGIALSSAGVSATAAYRRRVSWPPFARGWSEALACDDWEVLAWVPECIAAMLDGVEQSPENPVRITSVAEVIRLYAQDLGKRRGRPMR